MLAALVAAAGANADPLRYGVADDYPVFHTCGDVWWQSAKDIGYQDLRMTVQWNGTDTIPNQGNLQAAIDCALLNNMRPILAIYPAKPTLIGSNDAAQQSFARFVGLVGQAFPHVTNFIVGNEPNVNRFWQPQYTAGQDAAGKDYEHTLAYSYDALKAVRPDSIVWGPAISSRGNDNANASSNPSHSPVWFIYDMAKAYKASGRTKPIFDEFDMHPYPPVQDTDPFSKPFQWPQAGAANLDRIKQALWDGFNGTGQPIPAEQAGGRTAQSVRATRFGNQGLPINLDEVGEQTIVLGTPHQGAYTDPPENVIPIDEPTQAQHYTDLAEIAACDPDVKALLYFPLIDNTDINKGFQSGQLYADFAHKQSYGAMKQKIASAQGQCQGGVSGVPTTWVHTTQVIGAQGIFGGPGTAVGSEPTDHPANIGVLWTSFTVNEDASYTANVVNAAGQNVGPTLTGIANAYYKPGLKFPFKFPQGTYTFVITLTALTNPSRTTTLTSSSFDVGAGSSASTSGGGSSGGTSGGGTVTGPLTTLVSSQSNAVVQTLNQTTGLLSAYVLRLFRAFGTARQNLTGHLTLLAQRTITAALPHAGGSKFVARAGQFIPAPSVKKVQPGVYRLQVTMQAAKGGRTVTVTSPSFTVSAGGQIATAKPKATPKPKKKPKNKK